MLADEILYENSFKNDKKISNHQKIRGKIKFKITTWYVILLILFLGIQEKTKILNKYQIKYINSKYKLNYDAFFIKTIVLFPFLHWIPESLFKWMSKCIVMSSGKKTVSNYTLLISKCSKSCTSLNKTNNTN